MNTNFSGDIFYFNKKIKWLFDILAFLVPLIPSFFVKQNPWNILLPTSIALLPFLVNFCYLLVRGSYFRKKLKFILEKKSYRIKATGMFIDSSFKTNPNDLNNKVQLSNEYIIEIFIEYNFWKTRLKLAANNSISNSISSNSISGWVNVVFESKKLTRVSYSYKNKFLDNKSHKSKYLNDFNGVCNLVFNEKGKIVDYYYSSDGKNRFSFVKEWQEID